MELSKDTINNIKILQDANTLTDDALQNILESVVSQIVKNSGDTNGVLKYESKHMESNTAFGNLMCLFVEAARRDIDEKSLETFLNNAHIDGPRIKKICNVYGNHKKAIQSQLESVGSNPPHIVDVDWRLDYCTKVDTCNSVGLPLYHVRFSTRKQDGVKDITLTCTIQQLQELVSKLKDAVRHVEKLTNV